MQPIRGIARHLLADTVLYRDQDELFRAALWNSDDGRDAWRRWLAAGPRLKDRFAAMPDGFKGLLPLLGAAAARLAVPLDADSATYLRTALLREQKRIATYQRVSAEVLGTLAPYADDLLLVGGSALAERAYARPFERHSHDIDLLCRSMPTVDAAARALAETGMTVDALGEDRAVLGHRSQMHVTLRASLRWSRTPMAADPLWTDSASSVVDGARIKVPSTAAQMVLILGAAYEHLGRANPLWITDAWLLAARDAALDWDAVASIAAAFRLRLAFATMLDHLHGALDGAVPSATIERLWNEGCDDPLELDLFLATVRARRRIRPARFLAQARSAAERRLLLRHLMLPSSAYIEAIYGPGTGVGRAGARLKRVAVHAGWIVRRTVRTRRAAS